MKPSMRLDKGGKDEGFAKDFLRTPLHITWMNETMLYAEKIALSSKPLKKLFDEMMERGSVKGMSVNTKEEVDMLSALNLVFSAKNAQEIVIKEKSHFYGIKPEWDLKKSFKPVFEDMIINLYYRNEGYMPFFIQLFKIDETYKDPNTGEESKVYVAKTMIRTPKSTRPLDYMAIFEAVLIESKIPRVLFPSYISEVCRSCDKATESTMMDNVYSKSNPGVRYCLRTPRTYRNCKVVDTISAYPGQSNPTFAEVGFANINIITDVLDKLNTPPVHITKESVKREYTNREKNRYINHSERSYIEIKDVVVDTIKSSDVKHKGGTHASPVEHLRRGHERHYKNGKVVWIDKHIVNPGGKKAIYVIREKLP